MNESAKPILLIRVCGCLTPGRYKTLHKKMRARISETGWGFIILGNADAIKITAYTPLSGIEKTADLDCVIKSMIDKPIQRADHARGGRCKSLKNDSK